MVPAVALAVTLVCTCPCWLVVALVGLKVALPESEKLTRSPGTGLPLVSWTAKTTGFGKGCPTATDCPPPLTRETPDTATWVVRLNTTGARPAPDTRTWTGPGVDPSVTRAEMVPL